LIKVLRRYSPNAAVGVGLVLALSSIVVKAHSRWLSDCSALIMIVTVGSSLGRIRQEVCSYEPTLRSLRSLCDWAGVRFGFRNSIFRRLYLLMLPSLLLSIFFVVAAMIFAASHTLLRSVSDAFQLLSIVGVVVFLMRDRSIRSTIDKIESVAYSGRIPFSPPKVAKFILLLVPKHHRENLIGDLEEEYATILLPEFGVRKARTWYWWQVTLSVGPLLWAQFKRAAAFAWLWKRVQ
jgi:hypothetical protein